MHKPFAALLVAGAMSFALSGAVLADVDPTVHQIYDEAATGHLDRAQQMIEQVLRDHPDSAKAHYVQSELFAREGQLGRARAELDRAEQLEPGLPKENARAVAELKDQLAVRGGAGLARGTYQPTAASTAPASRFPWGTVLILAVAIGIAWMLFRRRAAQYPAGVGPGPMHSGYGPGAYPAAGGIPGGPVAGGGLGSTLAGGLAGGLAAGAGIVAGEELAHHFLDGDRPSATGGSLTPASFTDDGDSSRSNSDMGGADFGVNDPGSWDDDSSGGSGDGGGDWT